VGGLLGCIKDGRQLKTASTSLKSGGVSDELGALLLDLGDLPLEDLELLSEEVLLFGEVVDLDPPVLDGGVGGVTAVVVDLALDELLVGCLDVTLGDLNLANDLILDGLDDSSPLASEFINKVSSGLSSALSAWWADVEEFREVCGGIKPDLLSLTLEEGKAGNLVEPSVSINTTFECVVNNGFFSNFGVAEGEILITFTIVGIRAFINGNNFSLEVLLVVVVVDGVDDILVVLVGPGLLCLHSFP